MNKKTDEAPVVELRAMQYSKRLNDGTLEFSHYVIQWRRQGASNWIAIRVVHHEIDEYGNVQRC